MPGSPCFSNLDCAVNEKITNITQIINTTTEDSLDGQNNLNRYEAVFWQNTLICGQRFPKDNKEYKLKNNRCCRDHDKTFLWAQEELNYETPEGESETAEFPSISRLAPPMTHLTMSNKQRLSQNQLVNDILDNGDGEFSDDDMEERSFQYRIL